MKSSLEVQDPRWSLLAQRLAAYSLTAGAVLAATEGGQAAAIIFQTGLNLVASPGHPVSLDLDGGGADIQFTRLGGAFYRSISAYATNYAKMQRTRLTEGQAINPAGVWRASFYMAFYSHTTSGGKFVNGQFGGQRGYLPIRLNPDDEDHFRYGWIDVEIDSTVSTATIHGWAYNDTEGGPINAGQLSLVPEPAETGLALGLLALGAAGVTRWRGQRRTSEAQPEATAPVAG